MVHAIPIDGQPYLERPRCCRQWFFGGARIPSTAGAELYGDLVYVLGAQGQTRAETDGGLLAQPGKVSKACKIMAQVG
jgi:hypothetical protein